MAGFEIVVRPAVFPDIRPRPTPALPPVDDPTKGFAVIKGNGAGVQTVSKSTSISSSHSKPREVERRVDEARVYQMDDDGSVNKDNFVDIQVANKITMEEPAQDDKFANVAGDPGLTTARKVLKEHFYEPVKEKENVEVLRRDVVLRSGEEG